MRRRFLSVAVCVVLATLLTSTTQTGQATPGTAVTRAAGSAEVAGREVPLRVATYNMHTGIGVDRRLDLARTVRTLRALHADVIGLQEVDVHWSARSDWRDQARELAAALDMRVFFARIYSLDPPADGAPRREYGLAMLTRLPVMHTENHRITRLSTQSGDPVPAPAPGFPEVVVNAGGARVHFYATHLDYRADPSVREMQVQDTRRILAADGPDAQQVLVGDFNATPDSPELSPLWGELVDVWDAVGSGAGPTYPTQDPTRRIDYITVSPNVTPVSARVPTSPASDHLPVVADLIVRRGR